MEILQISYVYLKKILLIKTKQINNNYFVKPLILINFFLNLILPSFNAFVIKYK